MTTKSVALVTGANRGLGFEISRQLGKQGMTVLIGARNIQKGEAAAEKLCNEGLDTQFIQLDVTDGDSIQQVAESIQKRFGKLDVLVNNAAILADLGVQPSELEESTLRNTFEVNFFGPYLLTQALTPLLKQSGQGRVVNLATQVATLHQLADPESPLKDDICPAYQASKIGLNALTVLFAKELSDLNIKVNSVCPGWVMTDMGHEDLPDYGDAARPLSPEEAADTPVWLATLPADGPTGGFFNARQPITW